MNYVVTLLKAAAKRPRWALSFPISLASVILARLARWVVVDGEVSGMYYDRGMLNVSLAVKPLRCTVGRCAYACLSQDCCCACHLPELDADVDVIRQIASTRVELKNALEERIRSGHSR